MARYDPIHGTGPGHRFTGGERSAARTRHHDRARPEVEHQVPRMIVPYPLVVSPSVFAVGSKLNHVA